HANSGGAIEFSLSVVGSQVTDCVFDGNSAGQDGGAIRANIAVVDVERCTFHGTGGSSTLAMISSTLTVNACVIAGNVGDPLSCGNGSPIVSCCDVWGNAAGDTFCGTDGGGNFSTDPRFCDAAAGDLQLLPDSPCLDGQHPDGAACGTIGALGPCPGTGVGDGVVTDGWSRVKSRYR
ncbi:MAG: hypothetical protein KC591_03350, partial [Gemmatimonadetes bacterium]|nr:hypothetical protein [Gemmatimonadota bacterium]